MSSLRPAFRQIHPRTRTRLVSRTSVTATRSPQITSSRSYSSEPPAPPLLQKIKADLKCALRAHDTARLAVLRSVLSATLNASKTSSPISTDAQLVALLKKQKAASREASAEFGTAGRQDLVDKEEAQAKVLDEYVAGSGVEEVGEEQLRGIVAEVVEGIEGSDGKKMGEVMKRLLTPGGPLQGKDVEKAELAKVVKEVVG